MRPNSQRCVRISLTTLASSSNNRETAEWRNGTPIRNDDRALTSIKDQGCKGRTS